MISKANVELFESFFVDGALRKLLLFSKYLKHSVLKMIFSSSLLVKRSNNIMPNATEMPQNTTKGSTFVAFR